MLIRLTRLSLVANSQQQQQEILYKLIGPRLYCRLILLFILILIQYSAFYNIKLLCSTEASFKLLNNHHHHHNHSRQHRHLKNQQHHNLHGTNNNNTNTNRLIRTNRAVYLASLDNANNGSTSYISRQTDSSIHESSLFGGGGGGSSSHSGRLSVNYPNHLTSQQDQPAILDRCCACDEAKYELVFEGLWSRYTHPDDFPDNYWLAYFSDIIGASHSNEFRMWAPDSFASEGVRELAETGATKKLESELKQVSSMTRTIIKARELRYPTLNSKTSAVFRTDRHHHLISILSKLGPSPDWMVGVSGLELCQADCSWSTQRVVNLYLWDAGTDSGPSFTASDMPTRPQDRIHPFGGSQRNHNNNQANNNNNESSITSNARNNFDEMFSYQAAAGGGVATGDQSPGPFNQQQPASNPMDQQPSNSMKPFARLTVTRQRIYEKSCNGGEPSKMQHQLQQQQQQQQQTSLSSSYPMSINQEGLLVEQPTGRPNHADCRFSEWSDWSSCSSTCGKGIRTRTRAFLDEQAHLAGCPQSDLIEKEVCLSECLANSTTCVTRDWTAWSKCSVDCGQGIRKRTRSPIGPMRSACDSIDLVETEACAGQCAAADNGDDPQPASHLDNGGRCETSQWSQWSECSVACGRGTKIRTRQFVRREDADLCRDRLIQKQACTGKSELCRQAAPKGQPMPTASAIILKSNLSTRHDHYSANTVQNSQQQHHQHQQQQQQQQHRINPNLPVIDCKLSNWSPWSTCSALCGHGRRTRSRFVIQMPQNGGKPCDRLTRTQKCKDLPPCPPSNYGGPQSATNSNAGGPNNNNNNSKNGLRTNNHHQSKSDTTRATFPLGTLKIVPTTSTTTASSSMMDDDEDDSEGSALNESRLTIKNGGVQCDYGNWTEWSECEVVCQPVQKGSIKVRHRFPNKAQQVASCQIMEELYYCDPKLYC